MSSQFRQPTFLSPEADNEPSCRVRCPVHGFIRYSKNEQKIIDHRVFRRLRFIKQLALTDYVYPGATHTRFEHSLGVMHVATLAFDRLATRCGAIFEEVFGKVEVFEEDTLARARQSVRLAALLHDVGHAPFSHAAEEVIHKETGHEGLTITIITEPAFLGDLLDTIYFPGCAAVVARIINGPKLEPQLKVLRDIISGQMDADRTDYLLRDSHHCGVEYGRFDYRRMIECLTIWRSGGDALEIALDRDGLYTFEALILSRYQMNVQVYYHRLRRIYDYYLRQYFKEIGSANFDSAEKILAHNDSTMMTKIMTDAESVGEPGSIWAKRIFERMHHRQVHVTGESTDVRDRKRSEHLFNELKEVYSTVDFIWDCPEKAISIHSLLIPGDQTDEKRVELLVIDKDRNPRQLARQSHILRHVPREFRVARIFADAELLNTDLKKELREFATKRYRELGD